VLVKFISDIAIRDRSFDNDYLNAGRVLDGRTWDEMPDRNFTNQKEGKSC